jgi:hypothetical protein
MASNLLSRTLRTKVLNDMHSILAALVVAVFVLIGVGQVLPTSFAFVWKLVASATLISISFVGVSEFYASLWRNGLTAGSKTESVLVYVACLCVFFAFWWAVASTIIWFADIFFGWTYLTSSFVLGMAAIGYLIAFIHARL